MKTFKEFINEDNITEGLWNWIKTTARELKYDAGYNKENFPYIIRIKEDKNPIPYDVWKMTKYDTKKNIVIIEHMRNGKETEYTMETFSEVRDLLEIGTVKHKTGNGWYRIQLLESIEKKDTTITVERGAKIKVKTNYSSSDGTLDKTTKFVVPKKKANTVFRNYDWITVEDEDGQNIEVYFYDIVKFN